MEKIFVLGAGTMGAGIVQAFAQKGYEVIVRDIKDEFVERGLAGINKNLSKLVAKGKIEETEKDMANLHITDADVKPKASENIENIIEFVQGLIDNK